LVEPPAVTEATNQYWEENDIYLMFKKERIDIAIKDGSKTPDRPEGVRDEDSKMTLTEVYQEFKDWFGENFENQKVPERSAVQYNLEQRWGKLKKRSWWGIKRKPYDMAII
jgi:hypothetical protein